MTLPPSVWAIVLAKNYYQWTNSWSISVSLIKPFDGFYQSSDKRFVRCVPPDSHSHNLAHIHTWWLATTVIKIEKNFIIFWSPHYFSLPHTCILSLSLSLPEKALRSLKLHHMLKYIRSHGVAPSAKTK